MREKKHHKTKTRNLSKATNKMRINYNKYHTIDKMERMHTLS